ncbi:unnamed protein product [Mesocestoides corti]|nr:unnamed protein product [Mesocestoides corti]
MQRPLWLLLSRPTYCQLVRFISVFDGPSIECPEIHHFTRRKFPTVSTIINKTMPIENALVLRKWQEKMRKQLGDRGFNEYMSRVKALGQDVHQAICNLLLNEKRLEDIPKPIEGYIHSLEAILKRVTTTHSVEQECCHPTLGYRGRFDSINSFGTQNGSLVLTEWKTVHEGKRVTSLEKAYDAPLQVAAYTAAYNVSRVPEMPEVRQGLIAYAYADGYPADVLILGEEHLEHYFQLWLNRIEVYNETIRSVN